MVLAIVDERARLIEQLHLQIERVQIGALHDRRGKHHRLHAPPYVAVVMALSETVEMHPPRKEHRAVAQALIGRAVLSGNQHILDERCEIGLASEAACARARCFADFVERAMPGGKSRRDFAVGHAHAETNLPLRIAG
jgi:hypothetical protein